jgi:hypothetical protein
VQKFLILGEKTNFRNLIFRAKKWTIENLFCSSKEIKRKKIKSCHFSAFQSISFCFNIFQSPWKTKIKIVIFYLKNWSLQIKNEIYFYVMYAFFILNAWKMPISGKFLQLGRFLTVKYWSKKRKLRFGTFLHLTTHSLYIQFFGMKKNRVIFFFVYIWSCVIFEGYSFFVNKD